VQQRLRVLIVDDDAEDRAILKRLLDGDPDHQVDFDEADLGRTGLESCAAHPPDCILLDHILPDMSGLQFLARLSALDEGTRPGIVMITGQGDESVAVQAIKAGAHDYMAKDVATPQAVRRAVRNAVQKATLMRKIDQQRRDLEQVNSALIAVNRRLEDASRLKSQFLANASHELRTPLNSILGFLRLVADGTCESRSEEIEFITTALKSAESLLDLINVLLDISKIEAGKMVLDLEQVSLSRLFDDVYLLTFIRAQERGLALRFFPPEDASVTVRADYAKLRQILLNLLSNALKFTDQGGVTVRAQPDAARGFVAIEVADTGVGIRPELQRQVFEKFVQGDGSSTRKHPGTGLGLAIAKDLVELMGGVLSLKSPGVGQGTVITFTVPFFRDTDARGRFVHEMGDRGARINGDPAAPLLLIAEDDALFRDMIEHMAHQAGYATAFALTADDAVSMARKLKPAVITLDHALLGAEHRCLSTGWDAYAVLKSDRTTTHIPVIFVSGYDSAVRERAAEAATIELPRFLMKPFDKEKFLEALAEAKGVREADAATAVQGTAETGKGAGQEGSASQGQSMAAREA
jgi:signal transduction histidine kinase